MTLQHVQPGDRLSAARHNRLIDEVNALSRPGTPAGAQYGASGVTFYGPAQAHIGLFELVGSLTYPATAGAPTDHFDRDPTPFAPARPVWCHQHQRSDQTPGGTAIRSYAAAGSQDETTIWFPLARRDANGYAAGPPLADAGTRVLCVFNRQSGRWEAVQGPPFFMACWGKLDGPLAAGGSASVSLWWQGADSGLNVTAYDWLLQLGTSLPEGTKVKIEFFPQDGLWWVTGAECG